MARDTHNIHVSEIPFESEDEYLSDDEEYRLPQRRDPLYISESESEVDTEDEDEPSPDTSRPSQNKKKKYDWVPGCREFSEENCTFLGDISLTETIKQLDTPFEFFSYFFTQEMITFITAESNRFANDNNKAANITDLDIQQFLGVVIYMSVVHFPTVRHYWKRGMEFEPIVRTMNCNRFEEIKRFLHFVNNSTILPVGSPNCDKLAKIRPFLTMIRERLLTVPKEEYLAVDEQIIPTKTRKSSLKQYNPKKPNKWGYKVHVLSGVSGFSYDFDIYAGKQSDVIPENEKNLGTSSNVVLRLAQTVPENLNYKLFFDNWFTSVELMAHLDKKGILPLGTVRANRLPGAKLTSKKEMTRKGRGASEEIQTSLDDSTVTAVSWLDNKIVTLCSTYVGVQPTTFVERYDRKRKRYINVSCPKAVELYNRHMGGVDTLDSMLGYYRIKIRSKKWYMRVFFHFVDLACVNAWLLWRRKNPDTYIPLLDFKLLVADVLTQKGSQVYTPTTRGRPSNANIEAPPPKKSRKRLIEELPSREVAEDGYHHFPDWTEERQVCKNSGCKGKSFVWCLKCKVHLCINKTRNCFVEFHVE